MIQYFFEMIPRLLFEPVAVVALLGCITTLFLFHKKNNPFFSVTLAAICFMFIWRVSIYSVMVSSRYATIILYPAIIFNVLFCFHVKEAVQWCERNFFHSDNHWGMLICMLLPYVLLSMLIVACLVKTLRFNPYADYRIKLCKALAGEIEGKKFLLYVDNNHLRQIAYYTGLDIKAPKPVFVNDVHFSMPVFLKKKLEETKNSIDNVYFVFSLKKGEQEPDAQNLGIGPEMGKWECIYRTYTSRRKNRETVLYRFIPAHPNIEVWEREIPAISPDNLCKNGDFEQVLSPIQMEQRIAFYKEIGASDFYLTPGRLFPVHWWLGVGKPTSGGSSEMVQTAQSSIAGKYSLSLKSGGPARYGLTSNFIPKQDCVFSGFIRSESEALVRVSPCYRNTEASRNDFIYTYLFYLHPGKTYRFSFPVRMKDVPGNDKYICLNIMGYGHILVDNVECISAQGEKRNGD